MTSHPPTPAARKFLAESVPHEQALSVQYVKEKSTLNQNSGLLVTRGSGFMQLVEEVGCAH